MEVLSDWRWMIAPFLACLILSLTHVYLGIHVVSRKVIFVDLALAQIAALGAIYAVILGYDPHSAEDALAVALFSLSFTFVGAGVFSLARMKGERVPQEAFIGIIYAAASAGAVLILSKSPAGGEHLREMLVGDVLLVPMSTIVTDALLYSSVGIFHYIFRQKFLAISLDAEGAERAGVNIRLWDIVFYMTFGVLVTRSVAIAGVLLVFSYLVIPAVIAQKWVDTIVGRLWLGWAVAILASIGGILWSFYADYPTGPAVVMMLAAFLVGSSIVYYIYYSELRLRALAHVALIAFLSIGFFWTLSQFRKERVGEVVRAVGLSDTDLLLAEMEQGDLAARLDAVSLLSGVQDPRVVPILAAVLESTDSDQLIEQIVATLALSEDPAASEALREASTRDFDAFLKLTIAEALIARGDAYGYVALLEILRDSDAGFARLQAIDKVQEEAGEDFGYDWEAPSEANEVPLSAIEGWIDTLDP